MATKSQKDWVSPHKVSLLILIKYLSSTDEEHEEHSDCIGRCRHKLSLLLLQFFEVQTRSVRIIFKKALFHACVLIKLNKLMSSFFF